MNVNIVIMGNSMDYCLNRIMICCKAYVVGTMQQQQVGNLSYCDIVLLCAFRGKS